MASSLVRRPHSTYKKVVQGKCPLHFLHFSGVVCSNTLFSNTSALTNSLLLRANSTCNVLEHLVWSNTSRFQFWGPLARTNLLSALCGLPTWNFDSEGHFAQFDLILTMFWPMLTCFDPFQRAGLTYFHLFRLILQGGPDLFSPIWTYFVSQKGMDGMPEVF